MERRFDPLPLHRQWEWAETYKAHFGGYIAVGPSPLDPVRWRGRRPRLPRARETLALLDSLRRQECREHAREQRQENA